MESPTKQVRTQALLQVWNVCGRAARKGMKGCRPGRIALTLGRWVAESGDTTVKCQLPPWLVCNNKHG